MKNILTLLVSLTVVTAAFAQRDEARRVILGGDDHTVYSQPYPGAYPGDRRIDEINRDYDARIFLVRTDPRLSRREKRRIIEGLEVERRQRIDAANYDYNDRRWHRDDDDRRFRRDHDRDDYRDHDDHGNHYGWDNGKGNPHRDD